MADLAQLVGEVIAVERAPVQFQVEGKGVAGRFTIGKSIQAELEPFTGATGEPSALYDRIFTTIPGSPAYVGRHRCTRWTRRSTDRDRPQGHNAVSASSASQGEWSARAGDTASTVTPSGTFGLWPRVRDNRSSLALSAGWSSWHGSASGSGTIPVRPLPGPRGVGAAGSIGDGYLVLLALFVGGWTLMTVAMMLPTSMPLVAFFRTLVRKRSDRVLLVACLYSGSRRLGRLCGTRAHGDLGIHTAVERVAGSMRTRG